MFFIFINPYRYAFNGKEKDDEVVGNGNRYDFGDRIYDPRLGRWLSIDPLQNKYPNLSPYNAFENSPIFFNDPDGRDAIGKVEGKNITVSSTIYIMGNGATQAKAAEMQKQIMSTFTDQKYSDGKNDYNVKFDIQVKVYDPATSVIDEGSNIAVLKDKDPGSFRSNVLSYRIGRFSNKESGKVYSHETGHFLGLADQYVDFLVDYDAAANLKDNRKDHAEDYKETAKDELMGTGLKKLSQKDVNAIASFILENKDKNGKTVISEESLNAKGKSSGLAAPTSEEKIEKSDKAVKDGYKIKETE